jgi:hypothetical protein
MRSGWRIFPTGRLMPPHQEASNVNTRAVETKAAGRVLALRQESDASSRIWPEPAPEERPMPAFTWEQLERQLADLSGSPARAAITPPLVSALRKQSPWMPAEMVLRELLCLAWTLMDESFQPGRGSGEGAAMR